MTTKKSYYKYYLREALDVFGATMWLFEGVDLNPAQKKILAARGISARAWTALLNNESNINSDELNIIAEITKIPVYAPLMTPEEMQRVKVA
ncbi:MAG: hypothetical protein JNL70_06995 [Saprospiraceae bacterium]|nr:hypothetical protein [Saprospiraceae bacterium]